MWLATEPCQMCMNAQMISILPGLDNLTTNCCLCDTSELLLKDSLNKGDSTFDLSIKDKSTGPYRIMIIQC